MKLSKRTKRKLIGLALSLVLLGVGYMVNHKGQPPAVLGTTSPGFYKVTSFADGDTITVDMDGTEEKIRMIGVDTPETHDPRKAVQCFGQAASDYTKQLIGSQPVRLVADPLGTNRDRYDRLLRYIYLPDGRLVEAEIIKGGYGFAYTSFPFGKSDEFKQFETEAKAANRGLWGSCQPTTNQYGGQTSNPAQ